MGTAGNGHAAGRDGCGSRRDLDLLILDGTIVYSPTDADNIELAGACELIDANSLRRSPDFHLFDGRSIVLRGPA